MTVLQTIGISSVLGAILFFFAGLLAARLKQRIAAGPAQVLVAQLHHQLVAYQEELAAAQEREEQLSLLLSAREEQERRQRAVLERLTVQAAAREAKLAGAAGARAGADEPLRMQAELHRKEQEIARLREQLRAVPAPSSDGEVESLRRQLVDAREQLSEASLRAQEPARRLQSDLREAQRGAEQAREQLGAVRDELRQAHERLQLAAESERELQRLRRELAEQRSGDEGGGEMRLHLAELERALKVAEQRAAALSVLEDRVRELERELSERQEKEPRAKDVTGGEAAAPGGPEPALRRELEDAREELAQVWEEVKRLDEVNRRLRQDARVPDPQMATPPQEHLVSERIVPHEISLHGGALQDIIDQLARSEGTRGVAVSDARGLPVVVRGEHTDEIAAVGAHLAREVRRTTQLLPLGTLRQVALEDEAGMSVTIHPLATVDQAELVLTALCTGPGPDRLALLRAIEAGAAPRE